MLSYSFLTETLNLYLYYLQKNILYTYTQVLTSNESKKNTKLRVGLSNSFKGALILNFVKIKSLISFSRSVRPPLEFCQILIFEICPVESWVLQKLKFFNSSSRVLNFENLSFRNLYFLQILNFQYLCCLICSLSNSWIFKFTAMKKLNSDCVWLTRSIVSLKFF